MIRFADDTANAEVEAANQTPAGKRALRRTVYGTLNGYVGGKFWCNFGDAHDNWAEREANEWLNGAA
jgi:hypothetical protein